MVEDEGEGRGIESNVQGIQHRAGHRYAKVSFEYCGGIGRHDRYRISPRDAAAGEGASQLTTPSSCLTP